MASTIYKAPLSISPPPLQRMSRKARKGQSLAYPMQGHALGLRCSPVLNVLARSSTRLLTLPSLSRHPLRGGFTLVELLVVLSIVAVLGVLAGPSFSSIMASRSAKSAASELFSSLVRARSEAMTRSGNVTLAPVSGDWQNGWQIFSATNTVLDNRPVITGATITGPNIVVYRPSGRISGATAPSFLVTAVGAGSTSIYQCVSVDLTGRPYIKAASSC